MARPIVNLEVINFKQELRRIEKEVLEQGDEEILDLVDYAVDQLRVVTPVDTGEARSGWYSQKVRQLDGSSGSLIINEVEHISSLNKGSSQQAPKFFIEQVLVQIGILTSN
jgi:hypothetical protein